MRIELLPDDFDESLGEGSPTVDVCRDCVKGLQVGDDAFLEGLWPGHATVVTLDCEHPPYTDDVYKCRICGELLTAEN